MKYAFLLLLPLLSACVGAPTPLPSLDLEYELRPANSSDPAPPLVVLLHGYNSNAGDMLGLAKYFPPEYAVVCAQAPLAGDNGGRQWYPLAVTDGQLNYSKEAVATGTAAVAKFLRALPAAVNFAPDRVILGGFSQGAIVAYGVALAEPDLLQGVVALSGQLLPEMTPAADLHTRQPAVAAFIGHGMQDDRISVTEARAARRRMEELGFVVTYHESDTGHTVASDTFQQLLSWLAGRHK